jgi:hypothetical protein
MAFEGALKGETYCMVRIVQAQAPYDLDVLSRERRKESLDSQDRVCDLRGRVKDRANYFMCFEEAALTARQSHWVYSRTNTKSIGFFFLSRLYYKFVRDAQGQKAWLAMLTIEMGVNRLANVDSGRFSCDEPD